MNPVDLVIATALAEVGYREKASNASLDDPQANAGSGNWTKYARDLAAAGYYNGNKNGYAWCECFVDWCFFKAFGPDGQRIQCQTGDLGAACIYSMQYYRQQGRCDQNPKEGDQVFFYGGGTVGHTGIVVEVSESSITVVEGNSSDRVQKLSYPRSSGSIAGYGHPKYDQFSASEKEIPAKPSEADLSERGGTAEGASFADASGKRDDSELVTTRLPLLKPGAIELKLNGHTDMTERDDECELGYWIAKPLWGRGLITEAAGELLRHAFEDLGMTKVWAGYYDGNARSKRVQEKCGFRYQWKTEGVDVPLMHEKRTGHTSSVTRDQWQWDRLYAAAAAVRKERRISDYVTCGEVSAAILSGSGNIYTGVCIDTCSTLGICAERNAIFNMITNGEQEIRKVIAILPDGSSGAPCGACRELMVQLMPESYRGVQIMTDYRRERVVTLGELTPEWWI